MEYNPVLLFPKTEADAMNELLSIGARIETDSRKQLMESHTVIRLENLSLKSAWKLKQMLLHHSQSCIIHEKAEQMEVAHTDALILGTVYGIDCAIKAMLQQEDKDISVIGWAIHNLINKKFAKTQPWTLPLRNKTIDLNERTWIMGILNVTPNSFSDGGRYDTIERAVVRAKEMEAAGADIIDIGGESTHPGAEKVSMENELERVIPAILAVRKAVNIPISIDTYKAEVAKQAVEAGADIINDIWGAKGDANMAETAAELQVPIILMHNRNNRNYHHLISDMARDLRESIELVKSAGVVEENIILDPGIGFAKTYEDNLEVMNKLDSITTLGFPVLLGTSRKAFIGRVLETEPNERVEGTGATTCLGIQKGCQIIRVHDVLENKRMATMMDAMLSKRSVVNNG